MAEIIAHAFQRGEQGYEFECEMPTKNGKLTWIRITGRFTDKVHDGFPVIYTIYTDHSFEGNATAAGGGPAHGGAGQPGQIRLPFPHEP